MLFTWVTKQGKYILYVHPKVHFKWQIVLILIISDEGNALFESDFDKVIAHSDSIRSKSIGDAFLHYCWHDQHLSQYKLTLVSCVGVWINNATRSLEDEFDAGVVAKQG